jgi:hypothetical protein
VLVVDACVVFPPELSAGFPKENPLPNAGAELPEPAVLVPPNRLGCELPGACAVLFPKREVVPGCAVPNRPPLVEPEEDGKLNGLFPWSAIVMVFDGVRRSGVSKDARNNDLSIDCG